MAHPDPKRGGSEKGQREHAGKDSEATDAGVQSHSQGARGAGPIPGQGGSGTDLSGPAARTGADNRTNDIDASPGLVSPEVRSDRDGPLRGDTDRESGAGAAGGRDTSPGTRRGHGTAAPDTGEEGSSRRQESSGETSRPRRDRS